MNSSTLLVLNYEMDESSQVFSHQIDVVRGLAKVFNRVVVITNKVGSGALPNNVEVYESSWTQGKRLRNSIRFLWKFCKILRTTAPMTIFSHMTEVQSVITSPITRFLGIRHVIWYAHKSKSSAMNINSLFVDRILTSTSGSCPYIGKKVQIIGQAIDEKQFFFEFHSLKTPIKLVHIGRFDPSKNIDSIIRACDEVQVSGVKLSLTIVGAPSSSLHFAYADSLKRNVGLMKTLNWINFQEPIARNQIPDFLHNFDIFVHAFEGSLDKSIVEATFSGLPVVTINKEYLRIFGSWSNSESPTLNDELLSVIAMHEHQLAKEIERRHSIALSGHSMNRWLEKLVTALAH